MQRSTLRKAFQMSLATAAVAALLPGVANASYATPNPDLSLACGLKVTLVLDASSSIRDFKPDARSAVTEAAQAFGEAFAGTGSTLGVVSFREDAVTSLAPTVVTHESTAKGGSFYNALHSNPANPRNYFDFASTGSGTNWESGLALANSLGHSDLVVFVTDGQPNHRLIGVGSGAPVTDTAENSARDAQDLSQAIKNSNTKVLGIGVGEVMATTTLANYNSPTPPVALEYLEQVTEPAPNTGFYFPGAGGADGSFEASSDDLILAGNNFDALQGALRSLATELCSPSLSITKLSQSPNSQEYLPTPGVAFTATPAVTNGSFGWVLPNSAPAASKTVVTNDSGVATFQWEPNKNPAESTVTLTEVSQPGYTLTSLTCRARNADGVTRTLTPTRRGDSFTLTAIGRDIVTCEARNSFDLAPSLSLSKTVAPGTGAACPGSELTTGPADTAVTYCFAITNTGNTTLGQIQLADPDLGVTLTPAGGTTLAPGGSLTLKSNSSITKNLLNHATATAVTASTDGKPLAGAPQPQPAIDTAEVKLSALSITKTAATEVIRAGASPVFELVVKNTGSTVLTNVAVLDPLAPNCARTSAQLKELALLAPGASVTFTCSDAPRVAGYTNLATATGVDPSGISVTARDDATVAVLTPSILLTKTTPEPTVAAGSTVTWNLKLVVGSMALADVTVTDAAEPTCNKSFGTIGAGETRTWSCETANLVNGMTNIATTTGQPTLNGTPSGSPVSSTSHADVDVPGIDVDKTTSTAVIPAGGTAEYSIVVTNTGEVDLINVSVDDPLAPACNKAIGNLKVAASITYTCSLTNVTKGFTNVAQATGTTDANGDGVADGPIVHDSDPAEVAVINPHITIVKSTATPIVAPTSDVTFTITVTNDGDVTLSNATVNDALTPACNKTIGELAVNKSATYTCIASNVTATFTNLAMVSATPPVGPQVAAEDTELVTVINPSISIIKTTSTPSIEKGGSAKFKITVKNTGDVDLQGTVVSDPLTPACDKAIGELKAGASLTYDCLASNVVESFTNLATVTATPPSGPAVTAKDTEEVKVLTPGVTISKTPVTQSVLPGGTATFTITVKNTGEVPLLKLVITDGPTPSCDRTIETLEPGIEQAWNCQATGLTADLINIVTVTGETIAKTVVTATATARVAVPLVYAATVTAPTATTTATASAPTAALAVTGSDPAYRFLFACALVCSGSALLALRKRRRATGKP